MSYKVTEEGGISIVHLDGEIDMDVTEKAKEITVTYTVKMFSTVNFEA